MLVIILSITRGRDSPTTPREGDVRVAERLLDEKNSLTKTMIPIPTLHEILRVFLARNVNFADRVSGSFHVETAAAQKSTINCLLFSISRGSFRALH